jgi:hypothetical protein
MGEASPYPEADLVVAGAERVVTMTGEEIRGGWVACKDGPYPLATRSWLGVRSCLMEKSPSQP